MHRLSRDTGIVIVDHGSRRAEANAMLKRVAKLYAAETGVGIVRYAHMELAGPSIEQAIAQCVEAGAKTVVLSLFFLSPGRHSKEDIPRLAAEAEAQHEGVRVLVSAPMGVDERLAAVLHGRVLETLEE